MRFSARLSGSSAPRRPARAAARGALALLLVGALAGCDTLGLNKEKPATPTVGNRSPILSRIATEALVDPALAGTAIVLPAPVANPDWPQAGGNAAKAPGHLQLSATPTRAWTATIAGNSARRRLAAAPVVGGGGLFAVDTEGVIHAFDAATGARRWTNRVEVSRDLRAVTFGGGATYFDGRVYAAAGTGDVVALDAQTGAEVWRVRPAGPLRGAPTVAYNSVYVMTQDNQIFSLATADGSIIWREAAASGQSGVFGVAAPAAGQQTIISGYSTGEVVAYRYENGQNLWSDALARTSISTEVGALTDVDADPIIDGGRVYALGQGGRMAAYELLNGQRVWELNLAGISTPALAGDWLFTLTDDSRLLAIARSTGRIRWITQLEHWRNPRTRTGPVFWTGPVLGSNRLWVASTRGEVQSIDVATGQATPLTRLGGSVSLAPLIAGQTLYILDDTGRITAWR